MNKLMSNNNSHPLEKCTILVDEEIKNIVQFILDNYTFGIIPFSSCQNRDNRSFIAIIVRDINDLNKLLERIFYDRISNGTLDFICEYNFYKNLGNSYELSWNSKCNKMIEERVNNEEENSQGCMFCGKKLVMLWNDTDNINSGTLRRSV
jgi:hypothetical protein